MTQAQAQGFQTKTERSAADVDPESIEAFAKRLIGSGFIVTERGRDARPPTMQEAKLIAHAAAKYDLDPLMGEVSVLGAKLYTNLVGVRKCARKIARLSGRKYCEATRPATVEEARAAAITENEHYWIADIIIDGGEESFRGHGFASNDNVAIAALWRDRQLVGYDPRVIRNMAENRAVRRALVAAFGLPFADPEDAREEAPTVPSTATQQPSAGPTEVYPAIPATPESRPTVVVDVAPQPEPVPVERARVQSVTYPAKDAKKPAATNGNGNGAPPARAASSQKPAAPAGPQVAPHPAELDEGPPPPIGPDEAAEILRREAAEAAQQQGR